MWIDTLYLGNWTLRRHAAPEPQKRKTFLRGFCFSVDLDGSAEWLKSLAGNYDYRVIQDYGSLSRPTVHLSLPRFRRDSVVAVPACCSWQPVDFTSMGSSMLQGTPLPRSRPQR